MMYDVTIGIPVFRSFDYVRDAMMSALGQTFLSVEILVVDDGGNDGSIAVINELQQTHPRGVHIHIVTNPKNMGAGYSRNRIIDEAKGKFLYFMDSDDTIEPNTIQLLYDAIVKNQAEVAYGSYEIVDLSAPHRREVYQKDDVCLSGDGQLAEYVLSHVGRFHVSACNCLMDLEFLRQSGVRFINTNYWEDMAFTYELVPKVTRAVLLSCVTYHYLRHSGSLSHYQAREQLQKEEVLANASTLNYLKEKCKAYRGHSFLPYMCYNLELNSFYIICHVLKNAHLIAPGFSHHEMRDILCYPLSLPDILCFRSVRLQNLLFWLLSRLPVPLFVVSVKVLGKLKKAI